MDELAKLAYEAALRALDKQEEVVRELRSRTALLLAASSFAISVGGEAALRASALPALAAVIAALAALMMRMSSHPQPEKAPPPPPLTPGIGRPETTQEPFPPIAKLITFIQKKRG